MSQTAELPTSRYQPRTVLQPPQERLCDTLETAGVVTESDDGRDDAALTVSNVALQGVTFRARQPIQPGSIRHLKVGAGQPRLSSRIRVISCRPRTDGTYVIGAEFF